MAYLFSLYVFRYITLPSCYLYELTGIYCPGCGCTRAVYALIHGDVILSLKQNPLVIVSLAALFVLYDIYGIEKYISAACSDRACVKLKLYNLVERKCKSCLFIFWKIFRKSVDKYSRIVYHINTVIVTDLYDNYRKYELERVELYGK